MIDQSPLTKCAGTVRTQFIRFILVGLVVAAAQFIILIVLVEFGVFDPLFASSIGFILSAGLNYILNYTFTFRSTVSHKTALARFMAVALSGLILNAVLMKIGTDMLSLHYVLTQIGTICCVVFWNFFLNRHWTFGAAKTYRLNH